MHIFAFARLAAIAAAVIVFTLFVNWLVGSFVPVPATGGVPTPVPDINQIVTATFQAMTQEARQTAEALGTPIPEVTQIPETPTVLPRSLYYSAKNANGIIQIYRLERDGTTVTQITNFEQGTYVSFDISPVNRSIVYSTGNQLISIDANGGNRQVLVEATNSEQVTKPVWSPDGKVVAYMVGENIYLYSIDTGNSALMLTKTGDNKPGGPLLFSPDGQKLLLVNMTIGGPIVSIYNLVSKTLIPTKTAESTDLYHYCGEITWINSDHFFCHYHKIQGVTIPGLWKVNANDGSNKGLIWSTTTPFQLVAAPHLDSDGKLYYLYGEDDGSYQQGKPLPRLSLVRSDADGITNRVVLRPETFLVRNAFWTPNNDAILILEENENILIPSALPPRLLLVPVNSSLPVLTILQDARNLNGFLWGP